MLDEMDQLQDEASDTECGHATHESNQIVSLDESKYQHVDLPDPRLCAQSMRRKSHKWMPKWGDRGVGFCAWKPKKRASQSCEHAVHRLATITQRALEGSENPGGFTRIQSADTDGPEKKAFAEPVGDLAMQRQSSFTRLTPRRFEARTPLMRSLNCFKTDFDT